MNTLDEQPQEQELDISQQTDTSFQHLWEAQMEEATAMGYPQSDNPTSQLEFVTLPETTEVDVYNPQSLLDLQLEPSELTKLIRDKLEKKNVHPEVRRLWFEILQGVQGNNVGIPLGDAQLDANIMVRKAMMICLGGLTGSAKSSCLDDIFLLKLFKSWLVNEHDDKFPSIEWTYFSMERSPLFKRAKWLCWLMYNDYGVNIAVDDLLSWKRGKPINPDLLPFLPRLMQYIDMLEDKIDLIAGEKYANEIFDSIASKLDREGYHVHSRPLYDQYTGKVSGFVYVNGDIVGEFDENNYEVNKIGTRKYYVDVNIPTIDGTDRTVRVYETTKRYIPYDPRKIHLVVVDHLSKVRIPEGKNRKTANDDAADILAELRDYYGVTILIVNQFNREIYKEDTTKAINGVVPSETHFADSSSVIRNADLVLGIIDGSRLQDWRQGGYDVQSLVNPEGYCTLRVVHVVKSTYGGSGAVMGFSFVGKCGYFRSLPKANFMTEELYWLTVEEAHQWEGQTFEEHVALSA